MAGQALSLREQHTLRHLRHAEAYGVSLEYYATSYKLNLQQLRAGQAQLERKGFWPIKAPLPAAPTETCTELLAVQVVPEADLAEAGDSEKISVVSESEPLHCRLTAPNGWVIECDRWPQAEWLAALMGGVA